MASDVNFDPGDLRYRLEVLANAGVNQDGVLQPDVSQGEIWAWVRPTEAARGDRIDPGREAPIESRTSYKVIWRKDASPQPIVGNILRTSQHGDMRLVSVSELGRFIDYMIGAAERLE